MYQLWKLTFLTYGIIFFTGSLVRFPVFLPEQANAWLLLPSTCDKLIPLSWAGVAGILWLLAFLALQRYLQVAAYSATLKTPTKCYLACLACVLVPMVINYQGLQHGTGHEVAPGKLKTCHKQARFASTKDSILYTLGMFGLPTVIQFGLYIATYR